jgi:hypothetical protein
MLSTSLTTYQPARPIRAAETIITADFLEAME